jgi:hypothetical protein
MSGTAWTALVNDANRDPGTANVADQDSHHDTYTLAAALVYARTGQSTYYAKAKKGILGAIGTEYNSGSRWLAISRNLTAYIVSADLLGLRADGNATSDGTKVENWIRSFLTKKLPDNNSSTLRLMRPFGGGSNAEAQEGMCYSAIGAYIHDATTLARAWDAFRTYACDPSAPDRENIDLSKGVAYGWAYDSVHPCAVNPLGTKKIVPSGLPGAGKTERIDGSIINDMRRGGYYQWTPGFTQYPWTGLAGFVPAAVILQRAGYPAFAVADRAVLRSIDYLWWLHSAASYSAWFDGTRGSEVVQLVNHYYGTSYPARKPVAVGHTMGYTDFTHP